MIDCKCGESSIESDRRSSHKRLWHQVRIPNIRFGEACGFALADPLESEEVNFQMNRIAYLGFSLLMILTAAIPILAQAPTEPPDVTAYRTLYGEKDPAKQAELSEKFLAETGAAFKDSMYRENTFSIMFRNYLQLQRWD